MNAFSSLHVETLVETSDNHYHGNKQMAKATFKLLSWPIYMEMAQNNNKLQCFFLAYYFPKTIFNNHVAFKWDLMCF